MEYAANPSGGPLADLQVFHGDASVNLARVYVRIATPSTRNLQLAGHIEGPVNAYSETLPARFALCDRGPGPSLLAEGRIVDPCFWTIDSPAQYRITVELRDDRSLLATADWDLGIRACAVRGSHIYWSTRRSVLRAIEHPHVGEPISWTDWRHEYTCVYYPSPHTAQLAEISRAGVPAIVPMPRLAPADVLGWLNHTSRHAAVTVVEITERMYIIRIGELRTQAPNLLFAASDAIWRNAPDCQPDLIIWDYRDVESLRRLRDETRLPICARRRLDGPQPFEAARYACDRLQRDLAPWADLAGYFV